MPRSPAADRAGDEGARRSGMDAAAVVVLRARVGAVLVVLATAHLVVTAVRRQRR